MAFFIRNCIRVKKKKKMAEQKSNGERQSAYVEKP